MEDSYKNYFKKFGFFSAFLVIVFGILIYPMILSRKSWQKNLKTSIEKVLEETENKNILVGENIEIKNSFATNAAAFYAKNLQTDENFSVIILRVATFYGPVATVFKMDENKNVEFIGFSSLHGRIFENLMMNKYSKRFLYWEKRIPYILDLNGKK